MKRILTVLAVIGALTASTQLKAQDDHATKNGFSINVELGIPSKEYGAVNASDGFEYGLNYGLQVGNRWYLKRFDKGGVALMANWFSYSMARKSEGSGIYQLEAATVEMTFVELGAMYSHPLNDDMAIDGYYNLEPTLIASAMVDNNDNGIALAGFGFGHAFGAAFRYKVLNIGLEYHLGSINGSYSGLGDISDNDLTGFGDDKVSTSHIKILVGVKF